MNKFLLGCLCLAVAATGAHAQAEIQQYNGKPTVFIAGKPTALAAYSPVSSKRRFHDKAVTGAARFFAHHMGAYLISIPSIKYTDWAYFYDTPFWQGDNFSSTPLVAEDGSLDEQAERILKGDPNAHFIIRFFTHEPKSWQDLHPDQLFVNEDGERLKVPSLASAGYRVAVAKFCRVFVAHCESRPWAGHIIGYANFERMEGTYEPIIYGWLFDHSALMTQTWRHYLQNKYHTVDALRAAFHDPAITFDTVEVPRDKLRGPVPTVTNILYWQNAAQNQPLRDYLLLVRDLYHQYFRALAGGMNDGVRASGKKRFLLYDTFKLPLMGWNNTGFFDPNVSWPPAYAEDRAASGHMNVTDLFDTPGFDGLITPHDYQARGVGGVYEPEGMADSAVLRGKMFFCEMDTRTYSGTDPIFPARNDKEFAAITWRNLATGWTRGFSSYWMDVSQDWFATPAIHKIIARQVQAIKSSVNWKHATVPGIAMVLDDTAILETNGSGNVFNQQIMWAEKMGLPRCGVPYRIYQFDDLKLTNFPKHCVFYFPNLYRVTPARLQILRDKVFRDGNVVVWGPGSGISDGNTIGTASATALTGFKFDIMNSNYQHRALVTNFDHPITRGLPADSILGDPLAYGPLLFPEGGVKLADAWTKSGHDESGLSVLKMGLGARTESAGLAHGAGDWSSVFTTVAPLPADIWRNVARFAGAHVYCQTNDVLMADSTIVALHSIQSGPKVIALPGRYDVTDVVTGKRIGCNLAAIRFQLHAPETRVFKLSPPTKAH